MFYKAKIFVETAHTNELRQLIVDCSLNSKTAHYANMIGAHL